MYDWPIIGLLSLAVLSIGFSYIAGRYGRWGAQNRGEAHVMKLLAKYCEKKDAHVLNNVTLCLVDGSTTQVDHILITTRGIFVIETKHYKGWIFANPKSKLWTQTIFTKKCRFRNPIHQNYKHVKAIQNIFEFLEKRYIYNVVVFSGRAVFKTVKPENVFYIEELLSSLEQYSDGALSLNRVQFCVGRLEYLRLELTQQTDIKHRASLAQRFGRF